MSKTILITGASSGIGLGLARAALDRGDRVLAVQRRPSPVGKRDGFTEVLTDLTDFDRTAPALTRLLTRVPELDLVVLNAGVLGEIQDLAETPLAHIERVMTINTWANKVLLDSLFARDLEVRQVVGMSSGAAVSGSRGWSSYALSKAAFVMLLKLYAAERLNTHFCSFAPGLVDTAMQDVLCSKGNDDVERFPSLGRIQSARGTETMPTPERIAERLLAAFELVRSEPSGSFVDIRQM